jgi:hypothetical protein
VPPVDGEAKRDGSDIAIDIHGRLAEILTIADATKAPAGAEAFRNVSVGCGGAQPSMQSIVDRSGLGMRRPTIS